MYQGRADRQDIGPTDHPPSDLSCEPGAARDLVQRQTVFDPRDHAHGKVVAQALAGAELFIRL